MMSTTWHWRRSLFFKERDPMPRVMVLRSECARNWMRWGMQAPEERKPMKLSCRSSGSQWLRRSSRSKSSSEAPTDSDADAGATGRCGRSCIVAEVVKFRALDRSWDPLSCDDLCWRPRVEWSRPAYFKFSSAPPFSSLSHFLSRFLSRSTLPQTPCPISLFNTTVSVRH